jgi:UDP-N-acetylglucosamine acyltransferase
MANARSDRIHPTAVISAEAELADDVVVGPHVIIEGAVRIGPGCVLRPQVHLVGPLTMGQGNCVYTGAVLGERPQHLKFTGEPTGVEIGDGNIFREHVTVHGGTTAGKPTRIGNQNFFMANSHIAHDCRVGDRCILANGALVAGHCTIEDGANLSGNCAVHQFVRIGRLALLSGNSLTTKDIPSFVMQQGINAVVGLNLIGMRRAGFTSAQIEAVRRAFHILYREGQSVPNALPLIEREVGHVDVVVEMVAFIRGSKRGINFSRPHVIEHSEAA